MKPCNCEQAQELTKSLRNVGVQLMDRIIVDTIDGGGTLNKEKMLDIVDKIDETLKNWSEK